MIIFQKENVDTTDHTNINDQFFIEIETDLLSLISDQNIQLCCQSYFLFVTNMISTYLAKSTKFYNFLNDYKDNIKYDIIFIDESNRHMKKMPIFINKYYQVYSRIKLFLNRCYYEN